MYFKYNLYNSSLGLIWNNIYLKLHYSIFNYTWIINAVKVFIFYKSKFNCFFNLQHTNYIATLYKTTKFKLCYTLFFIWRGFKFFLKNRYLFSWLSFSHYLKIKLSQYIWIICKKYRLFIYSYHLDILKKFQHRLTHFQRLNLYKGKGLFEYVKFKGFIKLKKIKKKQYL